MKPGVTVRFMILKWCFQRIRMKKVTKKDRKSQR